MEKRFLMAIGLSLLVLMAYSSLLPKPKDVVNKEAALTPAVQPAKESAKASLASEVNVDSEVNAASATAINPNILDNNDLYKITTEKTDLVFSKTGGYLYEVIDKTHNTPLRLVFKNIGMVKEWSAFPFTTQELPKGVIFSYRDEDGLEIKKTFRIKSDQTLELTIDIINASDSKLTGYTIIGGYFDPSEIKDQMSQRYCEASVLSKEMVNRKAVYGLKTALEYEGNIGWAGLRDRYFCAIFLPQVSVNKAVIETTNKGYSSALFVPIRPLGESSKPIEDQYKIYIGPQDGALLRNFDKSTEEIINFGTFDAISKFLLFLLRSAHKLVGNWGWAIIIVTILVYLITFPLSMKSMLSMKKMQALQPKIEELRAKHKDSPQKLNTEIMELYKREKVNPFGGCLPMILQIPVFFALYQLLMRLISLKGAHFLWIQDLSLPDRLIVLSNPLPMVGDELNLLPLLMAGGMFVQQKFSTPSLDKTSSAAEQQKIMGMLMPIIFGVLFYKMPSGLVLYWFVNNLLMLAFQWKISAKKSI
ncbi:MAG: membrane protein insertase YidC [Candidatus Omnitrophota bacterium]